MYRATRSYIETFVSALAENTDIKFVEGNGFSTDVETKTVTYDRLAMQEMNIDDMRGILLHEVGHLRYTQHVPKEEYSEPFKLHPALVNLYNICEDVRIEHLLIKDFQDFALYPLSVTQLYVAEENVWNYGKIIKKLSPYKKFCTYLANYLVFLDARPLANLNSSSTYRIYDQLIKTKTLWLINNLAVENHNGVMISDYYVKLPHINEDLIKLIDGCKDIKDIMKMVDNHIYPYIKDLLEDEKQNAKGQPQKLHGNADPTKENEEEQEGSGDGEEDFMTTHNILRHILKGSIKGNKYRPANIPPENELKKLFGLNTYILTRHFLSILQEKTTRKYQGAYKRGKLLSRNIYKVKTDEKRLYSKRNNPDTPFYEVTFLLDNSGSMQSYNEETGEGRYEMAYTAAYIIDQACRALKFKVNYVAWDEAVIIHKSLEDMRDLTGGGNDENYVLKRTEKLIDHDNNNIVFLLTDGGVEEDCAPAPMLEKLKKQGVHVVPIGVGLNSNQQGEFKHWYKDAVFANNMNDLVKKMAQYLKTIIFR